MNEEDRDIDSRLIDYWLDKRENPRRIVKRYPVATIVKNEGEDDKGVLPGVAVLNPLGSWDR